MRRVAVITMRLPAWIISPDWRFPATKPGADYPGGISSPGTTPDARSFANSVLLQWPACTLIWLTSQICGGEEGRFQYIISILIGFIPRPPKPYKLSKLLQTPGRRRPVDPKSGIFHTCSNQKKPLSGFISASTARRFVCSGIRFHSHSFRFCIKVLLSFFRNSIAFLLGTPKELQ